MRQGQCSTSGLGCPPAGLGTPHRQAQHAAVSPVAASRQRTQRWAPSGSVRSSGSSFLGEQADWRGRLHRAATLVEMLPKRRQGSEQRVVRSAARDAVSPQAWRHNWRYHRYQQARDKLQLPQVDWGRYHLQILFVDRTDTVRARAATGLLELVAEWNGFGRALYPSPCGVAAAAEPDLATSVALMAQAARLGIRAKLFAQRPEQFVYEDFDRFDIIVALDSGVLQDVLAVAGGPSDQAWYEPRCTTLTAFSRYCGGAILQRGGAGVLRPELRAIVAPVLARAMQARGIPRPDLHKGPSEWNAMVENMVVGLAGLVQYLMDAYPPNLPEYDPV